MLVIGVNITIEPSEVEELKFKINLTGPKFLADFLRVGF